MKARIILSTAACVLITVAIALVQTPSPPALPGSLARLAPAGAMILVEAKDFSSLIGRWNDSAEKAAWLESANYRAFSKSRLYLRLEDAYNEFAAAAGVPPDMTLVSDVAGGESALALYDIGDLEFLYITRLPSARLLENALWRARGNYTPRQAAGTTFYVRSDADKKRVVAFDTRDQYLLLASREDLVAGSLGLIASKTGATIADERWYRQAVEAAQSPGDLRLVLDLATVTKAPHFRSYWTQGNVSDLKQYASGVSDLTWTAGDMREERVLLRSEERPAPEPGALGELVALVPATAGLYRAWAAPTTDMATKLVVGKVLRGGPPSMVRSRVAPGVSLTGGVVGREGDLESRIDQELPATGAPTYQTTPLTQFIGSAPLTAALHVESTRPAADGIFVDRGSVIVLARAGDWPAGRAAQVLSTAIAPVWTKAGLGLAWREVESGDQRFTTLEGLESLQVAERGRLLFVANDPALLIATLGLVGRQSLKLDATFTGGFRHSVERERFASLMRLVDYNPQAEEAREPRFFSDNLVSLSETLAHLESISIVVRDRGARVSETVSYRRTP
jgi:hypothetical protein